MGPNFFLVGISWIQKFIVVPKCVLVGVSWVQNFSRTHLLLDPPITHEKKFRTRETSTRKDFGPTKYPHEKHLDPRNTHEKKF